MENIESQYKRPSSSGLKQSTNLLSTTPLPFRKIDKYEDKPVILTQRNFEDLLEEELQKSKEFQDFPTLWKRKTSTQYLKRGQGTLCTNSKSPTFKNQPKPAAQNFSPIRDVSPNKQGKKMTKTSSHIGTIKKLASTSPAEVKKVSNKNEEINDKVESKVTPLDLYKLRRERWKVKEGQETSQTHRKSLEKIACRLVEEGNLNETEALRAELRRVKDSYKKQENLWAKERDELKSQISGLQEENFRMKMELSGLKAKSGVPEANIWKYVEKFRDVSKQEIIYSNGTKRLTYKNGYSVIFYSNRDIKEDFPDGRQVYFFADPETVQVAFPDGTKLVRFKSGQEEKFFPNGTREIKFPDGNTKTIYPDDKQLEATLG